MNLAPCPNCGIQREQTRSDGRCVGCGKPLPDELRTPVPLPDQSTYAASAKELINRADTMGYEPMRIVCDRRAVTLVHELDRIGGAALMNLVCDMVLKSTDHRRAGDFRNAWLIALDYKKRCSQCGRPLAEFGALAPADASRPDSCDLVCASCQPRNQPGREGPGPTKRPWWEFW